MNRWRVALGLFMDGLLFLACIACSWFCAIAWLFLAGWGTIAGQHQAGWLLLGAALLCLAASVMLAGEGKIRFTGRQYVALPTGVSWAGWFLLIAAALCFRAFLSWPSVRVSGVMSAILLLLAGTAHSRRCYWFRKRAAR